MTFLPKGDGLRGQIMQLGQRVHALDRAAVDRQFDEVDHLRKQMVCMEEQAHKRDAPQIVRVEAQVHEGDARPESGRLTS